MARSLVCVSDYLIEWNLKVFIAILIIGDTWTLIFGVSWKYGFVNFRKTFQNLFNKKNFTSPWQNPHESGQSRAEYLASSQCEARIVFSDGALLGAAEQVPSAASELAGPGSEPLTVCVPSSVWAGHSHASRGRIQERRGSESGSRSLRPELWAEPQQVSSSHKW